MILKLLLLSYFLFVTIPFSTGFFFFNQKKTSEEATYATLPVSQVRGVLTIDEQPYTAPDTFQCRNSNNIINSTSVNDDFCDCDDGSDEPGTSACSYIKNIFHCVNKGYRTITIPTSRVDDGICDCCDGSDEGNIKKCPNTCEAIALKEREKLQKALSSYQVGSVILTNLENQIRNEFTELSSHYEEYNQKVEVLTEKVNTLTHEIELQSNQIQQDLDHLKKSAMSELDQFFDISVSDLSNFLVSLFNSLNLSEKDIQDLLKRKDSRYNILDDEEDDDEHRYEDHEEHDQNQYNEHHETIENTDEQSFSSSVDTQSTGSINDSSCQLLQDQYDSRLKLFCNMNDYSSEIKSFLVETLFPKKRPFQVLQLLFGYYYLHHTYSNSNEFVNEYQTAVSTEYVCPNVFQSLPSDICQIQEKLTIIYDIIDTNLDNIDIGMKEYIQLVEPYLTNKQQLTDYEEQLKIAEENKKESLNAQFELSKSSYQLAIHAYHDVKISVVDGPYKYSVTFLDRATQSNEHGSHEVNLGTYKNIIEDEINGDLIIKYTDGQYCHVTGPRTADLRLTCGPDNKLISAREPSTCYYLLQGESPIACTKNYAKLNGILDLV